MLDHVERIASKFVFVDLSFVVSAGSQGIGKTGFEVISRYDSYFIFTAHFTAAFLIWYVVIE
jgi:hypothetical protein